MTGQDGYQWSIEGHGPDWVWTIRNRDDGDPVVVGAAGSRAHAAACVVRALIQGVTLASGSHRLAA